MFDDLGAFDLRKLVALAALEHGLREGGSLLKGHAGKKSGHEKSRRLVIRDGAARDPTDEIANLFSGQLFAVALLLNDPGGC